MIASFNKWKKIDDLPPFVDEIVFIANQNAQHVNQLEYIDQSLFIFVDLTPFGIKELQVEIIQKSCLIKQFATEICQKYLQSISINDVQITINSLLVDYDKKFIHYDFKSNQVFKFQKFCSPDLYKQFVLTINIFDGINQRSCSFVAQGSMELSKVEEIIYQYIQLNKDICALDIYFHGVPLRDTKKNLFEYNIKANDELLIRLHYRGGCFPGDAPIKLFNGTIKRIKEIEWGDIVKCYDFEQQQFKQSIVVSKHISEEKQQLIEIITQNGRIVCTPNHLVYTLNGWKAQKPHRNSNIEKLSVDDLLFDSNGDYVKIVQINEMKQKEIVYNITTEYPNNFVAFDILVHNMTIIMVQLLQDNKMFNLEVEAHTLISELLHGFEEWLGIPVSRLQLFYKGIQMEDDYELEDYCVIKGSILDLKVIEQSETDQQEVDQNTMKTNLIKKADQIINEKTISILTKQQHTQITIRKNDQRNIRQLLEKVESKEEIERSLILCDGKVISSSNLNYDKTDLQKIESIILIDQQSGGIAIKFTLEIHDQQLQNMSDLQDSLQWLGNPDINEFIQQNLEEINGNQEQKQDYQQIPLHGIIAVRLYTSNLIYQKLNSDLRISDYQRWKKYLKCLMEGLRHMRYYNGVAYRGVRNYQNTLDYQKGNIVQWSEVSSVSQKKQVAQHFSNQKGMIFQVELISAKDIAKLSIYKGEQDVIMYPFSSFVIEEVQLNPNQPLLVTMRELPLPRSHQVLLWVDDNPENNYSYAEDLERQNQKISVIFCTSTKDAILIIQKYKWMIYLQSSQFRVVSDMVRIEEGKMNYNAGIDLIHYLYQQMKYKNRTLIFCGDQKRALKECQDRKINENKHFEITNNQQVLRNFLKFE
ncbi:unnamed protein product [Paramecium sonneborni]|uniref:NAD(P)(+)--arginine ADP-ribosyltransferase n=1 Tax=Paramecium sonneborni TaxID=65129 RepID=A0A8S1LDX0_9CILI|nr:unnamed protein product [Paramecium sonneborni]